MSSKITEGTADPEQLAALNNVLTVYCLEERIQPGTPDHDDAARLLMLLFNNDEVCSVEALREAMSARDR